MNHDRARQRIPTCESAAPGESASTPRLCVFATELGWMGIVGTGSKLAWLSLGHVSANGVREEISAKLRTALGADADEPPFVEHDWNPDLRRRLERFAQGERVDFSECEIDAPPQTAFQRRIVEQTRRIGHGQTRTYAEVAALAGSPRAARAVGNVMRSNRVPLIIPCHRVVASCGLGGYSAPQGLTLKRRLLDMEASAD